jgi:hypothetical protein
VPSLRMARSVANTTLTQLTTSSMGKTISLSPLSGTSRTWAEPSLASPPSDVVRLCSKNTVSPHGSSRWASAVGERAPLPARDMRVYRFEFVAFGMAGRAAGVYARCVKNSTTIQWSSLLPPP